MNILSGRGHKLRFRMDFGQITEKDRYKWNELKCSFELSRGHVPIISRARSFCKLDRVRHMPLLDRIEGGIGGNCNVTDKQIRPRFYMSGEWNNSRDNDIVLEIFNSDNGDDIWTYEELDDLVQAFIDVFDSFMDQEYLLSGCIELYPFRDG